MLLRGCFLLVSALVIASGCEEADDPCAPKRCDVRDRDCQRAIVKVVQCLRGGDSVMPDVSVITPDELVAMSADSEPTEEERLQFERVMRGYALFSLADATATLEDARSEARSEVAALYNHESKRIMVVDRGKPMNSEQAVATFAHEIVHAMQDVEHDLSALFDEVENLDAYLALKGLVEGEATHYEVLVYAGFKGIDADNLDWRAFYSDYQGDQLEAAADDASPIVMAGVRFPYAFGGHYVTSLLTRSSPVDLAGLFDTPPKSTREILLGSFTGTYDEIEQEGIPELPVGELFEHERLGPWLLHEARVHSGISDQWTRPELVAQAWGSDVASFFHVADGDRILGALRQRRAQPASIDIGIEGDRWSRMLEFGLVWQEDADLLMLASDEALDPGLTTDAIAWQMVPPAQPEEEEMSASAAIELALRGSGCQHPFTSWDRALVALR